jgi:hypothetical protein
MYIREGGLKKGEVFGGFGYFVYLRYHILRKREDRKMAY